jgi:UDP-3-O-[3-hydroxymyristoyl] glucosamine N-acyltransferase
MMVTLGDLAVRFGLALRGDPDRPVDHVGTLAGAGPRGIAFLANPKRIDELATANAAAVILPANLVEQSPVDCLIADNPHAAFARIADVLHQLLEGHDDTLAPQAQSLILIEIARNAWHAGKTACQNQQ